MIVMRNDDFLLSRDKYLFFLSFIMIVFPTSYDGSVNEFPAILAKCIIYGYPFVLFLALKEFNRVRVLIAIALLFLTAFYTLISDGSFFSYQASVPLISLLILLSLNIKKIRIADRALDICSLFLLYTLIIPGYLLACKNSMLVDFFMNFYSFLYEQLSRNMYNAGKPVLFFAMHSTAAIALTIFFLATYIWGTTRKDKHICFLSLLLIPLIVMQKSFTAYLSIFIIGSYFILFSNNLIRVILISFVLIALVYVMVILDNYNFEYILGNSNNGFYARYGDGGLYGNTVRNISDFIISGKGLLIEYEQAGADSGWLTDLIRGGLLYVVLIKILIFLSFLEVTKKYTYAIFFTIIFMLFDFSRAYLYVLRGNVSIFILLVFLNHARCFNLSKSAKV